MTINQRNSILRVFSVPDWSEMRGSRRHIDSSSTIAHPVNVDKHRERSLNVMPITRHTHIHTHTYVYIHITLSIIDMDSLDRLATQKSCSNLKTNR